MGYWDERQGEARRADGSRSACRFLTLTCDSASPGESRWDQRVWVREVWVDEREVDWVDEATLTPKEDAQLLERIFFHGQNDFQQRVAPSLSVDDLVVLDDANGRRVYRVLPLGFERAERHTLTRGERLVLEYASLDLQGAKALQFEEAERAMHAAGKDEEEIEQFRGECARRG